MQVPITPPPQTTILFSGCGCGAGGGDGGGGEEVAAMIGSGIENRESGFGNGRGGRYRSRLACKEASVRP